MRRFTQSPINTEILNRKLPALELNNVDILVWGWTRMGGFLYICKQCLYIVIPLLDLMVDRKIRNEETTYLLQLLDDIHPVLNDEYWHKTESGTVLLQEQ